MKTRLILAVILFSLFPLALRAQYKLSDKPDEFMADVTAMMAGTKSAEAIKTGQDFEAVWSSRFSTAQKQKTVAIAKKMLGKRYKAVTHFQPFFKTIISSVNGQSISPAELENLLHVSEKMVERYESKQLLYAFSTLTMFFEKKALFSSNYNRLYAQGGTFTLAFKEEDLNNNQVTEQNQQQEQQNQETQKDENQKDNNQQKDNWFSDFNQESNKDNNADNVAPTDDVVMNDVFTKPVQPTIQGAVIIFENINMVFATAYDSVALTATKGSLMLKDGIFVGNGGKFDWSMAGLPSVYCDIKEYNFNIRSPRLTAEGITLNYPDKLTAPAEGVFEFESKKHRGPEDAQYPRFMSYYNNISIKNIGENLVYKGGFSLVGKRNYSTSLNKRPSTLNYVAGGQTKFKTAGNKYEFTDSLVISPQVSITIPQNQDSIYHPATRMSFNKNIPLLRLNKHEGGFRSTPYMDTYHKVDITVDGLQWNLKSEEINFYILNARKEVPGVFESFDFYDSTRYSALKGIYNYHPLQLLMTFSNAVQSPSFYLTELAAKYKLNENTLRGAMMQMVQDGYIDYDMESGLIRMNRKGDHNVQADNRKRDYDSFRAESFVLSGANATLNLGSNELVIRGIERFYLSDKLNVSIKPRNKEIKLLKDRNFLLDGEVAAGTYKFKGTGFFFLYDEFTVEMPQIDTILFASQEAMKKGDRKELGGEIRYGAGTLYINKPNNKAGLKDFPEYPRLNVESGATIYFDQKDRLAGTYNRNVRFEIPSVKLDSLNSKDPDYQGTFYSDGIFPPFKEALTPMGDNTLGFRHKPAQAYYNLYDSDSKITFNSDIVMDMNGLRTSGTINHLSTTLSSKDIIFTPDSVVAKGQSAEIKETTIAGGSFPEVHLKEYALKWMPRADSMVISNTNPDNPFLIYQQTKASLKGMMVVKSTGLFGSGTFDRRDSEVYSATFQFDKTQFKATDAEFRIKSNVLTKPVLFANFVNVDFNMGQGLVTINTSENPALSGFASLEFPYAAYKTSINKAKWDIAKKSVLMEGDVKTTTFTSLEPSQENLSFNARFALYNIEKYTLNIAGIPFIQAADARILPKNGIIRVLENAVIEPLVEAKLSIDTVYAYHNLFDGTIQILSKSKFTGNATYKYTNSEKKEFNIKLGDFELRSEEATKKNKEPRTFTAAQGEVMEEDKFLIAPRILYKGKVTMLAPEKNLQLEGFIKLDLKSQSTLGAWIPYSSNGGQENIVISVDENLNNNGVPLTTGLHVDKNTSSIYTTFLSEKQNPDDKDIFIAKGQLSYNPAANEFKVAPVEKANHVVMDGNEFMLDDANGKIKAEGKLDLFNTMPNQFLLSSGSAEINLAASEYMFNTLLAFNFDLPAQAMTKMADAIMQAKTDKGAGEKEANENKEALYLKVAALIGNGAAKDYKNKSGQEFIPLYEASKKFLAPLVLSNVDLKWSEEHKAYFSTGKIGFSNILNKDINSQFNGMVEIRKLATGDEVGIYIEVSPEDWYYFSLEQNLMHIVSSNEEFNDIINSKAKPGKAGQFGFMIANADEKTVFTERFNSNYKGIAKSIEEVKKVEKVEEQKKEEKKDGF